MVLLTLTGVWLGNWIAGSLSYLGTIVETDFRYMTGGGVSDLAVGIDDAVARGIAIEPDLRDGVGMLPPVREPDDCAAAPSRRVFSVRILSSTGWPQPRACCSTDRPVAARP